MTAKKPIPLNGASTLLMIFQNGGIIINNRTQMPAVSIIPHKQNTYQVRWKDGDYGIYNNHGINMIGRDKQPQITAYYKHEPVKDYVHIAASLRQLDISLFDECGFNAHHPTRIKLKAILTALETQTFEDVSDQDLYTQMHLIINEIEFRNQKKQHATAKN